MRSKTYKEFKTEIIIKYGMKYTLYSPYQKAREKIIIKNNLCGHIYKISPDNLLRGKGCPLCAMKNFLDIRKPSLSHVENIINKSGFIYMSGYKNSKSLVTVKCKDCGEIKKYIFSNFYTLRPKCSIRLKKAQEYKRQNEVKKYVKGKNIQNKFQFKSWLKETTNDEIKMIGNFPSNIYGETKFKHLKCNRTFIKCIHAMRIGGMCPYCNESHGEVKTAKWLNDNKISFIKQYTFDNCKYKKAMPFDFYLPDKKVAIEYDGEQHYKPVKFFGGVKQFRIQQKRDNIKNEYCRNNGIKLIRIRDRDNINEVLKQAL